MERAADGQLGQRLGTPVAADTEATCLIVGQSFDLYPRQTRGTVSGYEPPKSWSACSFVTCESQLVAVMLAFAALYVEKHFGE